MCTTPLPPLARLSWRIVAVGKASFSACTRREGHEQSRWCWPSGRMQLFPKGTDPPNVIMRASCPAASRAVSGMSASKYLPCSSAARELALPGTSHGHGDIGGRSSAHTQQRCEAAAVHSQAMNNRSCVPPLSVSPTATDRRRGCPPSARARDRGKKTGVNGLRRRPSAPYSLPCGGDRGGDR
jgi:hypothetical protein